MTRNVYAWPPVDAIATMWSVVQPINRSQSFFTGADISSSAERKRRVASIEVPGIGTLAGSMNGGYCEMLKDLLDGGKNLVRVNSMPVNWYFDEIASGTFGVKPSALDWTSSGGVDTNWTSSGGTETLWVSSKGLSGTKGVSGDFHTVTIDGLPANTLVVRPGEYVKGYAADGLSGDGSVARALRPAYSDDDGTVVIFLSAELTDVYHVEVNASVSSVFMIDGELPSGLQPANGNWSYMWNFREVFSDEVGGFAEIDPWT